MTLKYLLDTGIISEPLRPTPNPSILKKLQRHEDEMAIATVVWHKLWFGCFRLPPSAKRKAIEAYLTQVVAPSLPILPYDEAAAIWHAGERARLSRAGNTPPFADGQIIAIAKANDLRLVTLNLADYATFHDVKIEDWR
ncbi:MAG: type II toxin-antitoxin system VapC family toxin [Chloroflexi bacterium]|nr:type II toxin-antitoxin system VapC family toxin [Chloroflexota bacterium]